MGEFDLSLIVEFRSRPSLYDRNSLEFKDKLFNAQQWQEISNKLGYDVSILKDRMLQLRNRYNLEKRRMEQLRDESPGKFHESPWPLYENLQFLSDHIKARRRYKSMLPASNQKEECQMNDSGNEYSALGTDDAAMVDAEKDELHNGSGSNQPFPNGLFTVKVEENYSEEPESEAEQEGQRTGDNSNHNFADSSNVMTEIHSANTHHQQYRQQLQRHQQLHQQQLQQQQHHLQQQQQQQHRQQQKNAQAQILPTRIIKRSMCNNISNDLENHRRSSQQSSVTVGGIKRSYDDDGSSFTAAAAKHQARFNPREHKYNAFGNFISSSLLDLPQKMALELVEKFTTDIVKALTMKVESMEAAAAAAADGDGDGNPHQQHHQRHHSQNEQ